MLTEFSEFFSYKKTKKKNQLSIREYYTMFTNTMETFRQKANIVPVEDNCFSDSGIHRFKEEESYKFIKNIEVLTNKRRINPSSSEFKEVMECFYNTAPKTFKVIRIEKVVNVSLKRMYISYKKMVEEKNQSDDVEIHPVWHGSHDEAIQSICTHGFNRSYAGRNGNKYGLGTYFAKSANYTADNRLSVPSPKSEKRVLLCRIVTGKYTIGAPYLKEPPLDPMSEHEARLDSLVDNINSPEIFVIFKDFAALPEYVVTFTV